MDAEDINTKNYNQNSFNMMKKVEDAEFKNFLKNQYSDMDG